MDVGFSYIGIGGLAGATSTTIASIISKVHSRARSLGVNVDLHVFGVNPLRGGTPDLLSVFKHNSVSSFDTTIMLRQAWSRRKDNYLLDGKEYTSIRVPMSLDEEIARNVLNKLRDYAAHKCSLTSVMNALAGVKERRDEKWLKLYRKTLEERPWDKCDCKICEETGIDTLIFRGNERNMRRGFHNVYRFYRKLVKRNVFSVLDFSNLG